MSDILLIIEERDGSMLRVAIEAPSSPLRRLIARLAVALLTWAMK